MITKKTYLHKRVCGQVSELANVKRLQQQTNPNPSVFSQKLLQKLEKLENRCQGKSPAPEKTLENNETIRGVDSQST